MEYLDVINEQDEVIGKETRKKIHTDGLLHREIHVWFVTPDGKFILQHRAKDKETFPDMLDATVGGHVELGASYEETAVKETKEETGLDVLPQDLIFMKKVYGNAVDVLTNTKNNSYKATYAYVFTGKIEDLVVEEGKAIGFEAWDIDAILNIPQEIRHKFVPRLYENEQLREVFKDIKEKILKK